MGGQRLLFFATLDCSVDSPVKSYLKNPKTHSLQNDRASVSTKDHHALVMHPGDKDLITAQIAARNGKMILFVKAQRGADRLAGNLAKAGIPVGALSGGKSQAVRTRTLKQLKKKKMQPAASMSMVSLSLFTEMHQQIIKILYTAQAAQQMPAKLVE